MARTDDDERTFSPWAVLGGFLVLGLVGLMGFLLLGGGESATEQLRTRQTTSTTTTVPPETTLSVTVPGGAPAPDGVREVLVDGPVTSYAFDTPADLSQVPIRTVVPPSTVSVSADGTQLTLVVECAVGVGEALAQVTVTADPAAVTVLPVTIGPADAPSCPAGGAPRTVVLTVQEPVGGRVVVVVPGGTEVPTPVAR